jgi:hypothetical protein
MLKVKSAQAPVYIFASQREKEMVVEGQFDLAIHRHGLFNKLVQFIARYIISNLTEMLYTNKATFRRVFCAPKGDTQFELSLSFNKQGKLDTDPSPPEHRQNFARIFKQMEDSIFKFNKLLFFLHDLPEMFYQDAKIRVNHFAALNLTRMIGDMETAVYSDKVYKEDSDIIFRQLDKDIDIMNEYKEMYSDVQEVYDFTQEWEKGLTGRSISLDMTYYNQTFEKINEFNNIIARLPNSNTKCGSILLETITLKKTLQEMPKRINNSIRNKVTSTMDHETQNLKDELSKTTEILEQMPTSLNVYVEQVNTLKYVK